MRNRRHIAGRILLFLLLCAGGIAAPGEAPALNRALDVRVVSGPKSITQALLFLTERPRYDIRLEGKEGLALTLHDAQMSPTLKERQAQGGDTLKVEEGSAPSALKMTFRTGGRLREIRGSWLEGKKTLCLEMVPMAKGDPVAPSSKAPATLGSVRFGLQDTFTRMVAGFNRRPDWELVQGEGGEVLLNMDARPGEGGGQSYGPLKRIRKAIVRQEKGQVSIRILPESSPDHLRIFWLGEGNKLVLDLLDGPIVAVDQDLFAMPDRDGGEEEAKPDARVRDAPPVKADSGKERVHATTRPGPSVAMGSFVRLKVPEREPPSRSGTGDLPRDSSLPPATASGKLRSMGPGEDTGPGEALVARLQPEESLLYGNILEALELNDSERGLQLIEDFLSRFPTSPITEELFFLRGDFRFSLLQRGNTDMLSQVLKDYQEAIARYGQSRRVPGAYVRMARASSYAGNGYAAIGYLNLVIGKYPAGAHLPLAYLSRGRAYMETMQLEKAVEDFRTVLEKFPRDPLMQEARLGLATYFHRTGLYGEAEKRLEEIAVAEPDFSMGHPEYLSLRGQNYAYLKRYDDARRLLFEALNLGNQTEGSDLLLCHIGDTYLHEDREDDAERVYRLVLETYPESEGASIAKLRVAVNSPGFSAFQEVQGGNSDNPVGDLALLEQAKKLYGRGEYSLAMKSLEKVGGNQVQSEIRNAARELYFKAAEQEIRRLLEEGRSDEVIAFYRSEGDRLTGNIDPEVLYLAARTFYVNGMYGEALTVYSRIRPYDLGLDSKGGYILDLADIHQRLGEQAEALSLLERKRKDRFLPADQQKMTLLLADLYRGKGDLKRARDLYQTLVEGKRFLSDQEIAGAYFALGQIEGSQNQPLRALESLNRCIALAEKSKESAPLLQSALVELGNSYYRKGRYEQAIGPYEKAFALGYGPDRKEYWDAKFRLALSHLEAGQKAEAERLLAEISEEGDPLFQQRVQAKLGLIGLENELKRLSVWPELGSGLL
ncbi:MAG: tetratricopeptide repeat protein [Deltaproteobacteria bacterium]|nr:tetratricopeptide repeat protein [Deltaproteobacteria bacterium]